MPISDALTAAINEQVGHEFAAMLQYVAIATYFDSEALPVLARHFYRQAEEEREHAMRFVKYLVAAGALVAIPAIPAATREFDSAEAAVRLSLEREQTVTEQINGLMDRAIKANDHTTRTMLGWFVDEQLEEVSSMQALLRMVRRAGEAGLLLVEHELRQSQSSGRADTEAEHA
jgi:ferritin